MSVIKPIGPQDIVKAKAAQLPDYVIESFNELIARNHNGRDCSWFKQRAVVDLIIQKNPVLTRQEIFDKHYLDVEEIYREAGWKVKYESPSYGDTNFEAYFSFSK